jgi:hypothetical protein
VKKYPIFLLTILATPAGAQEANWHLLTQSYGGAVSLQHNLEKRVCEFAKSRALGLPATPEEAIAEQRVYDRLNPPCPTDTSKGGWEKWHAEHQITNGCRGENSATSWGGGRSLSAGDIKSAECFQ